MSTVRCRNRDVRSLTFGYDSDQHCFERSKQTNRMDLAGMEIFARVVEAGGFSRAARRLDVSTSVVGKFVTRMEQLLGVRLLNRTTRSISLTEIGRAFYARCAQIVAEAEDAETMAAGMQSTPRATLVARKLAPIRQTLCAAPSCLRRHGVPATLEDLARHQCTVGEDLQHNALKVVLPDCRAPETALYATYLPNRYVAAKVRVFVDYLVARFGPSPKWDAGAKTHSDPPRAQAAALHVSPDDAQPATRSMS